MGRIVLAGMNGVDFDNSLISLYGEWGKLHRIVVYIFSIQPRGLSKISVSQHRVCYKHRAHRSFHLSFLSKHAKCRTERPHLAFCHLCRLCRQLHLRLRLHLFQKDNEPSTNGSIWNVSRIFNHYLLAPTRDVRWWCATNIYPAPTFWDFYS